MAADIVSIFRTAATVAGHEFAYGSRDFQEWEAGHKDLQNKDIIMMGPVIRNTGFTNGLPSPALYDCFIMYGVKNDGTYQATQDETYEQKYDRRLYDMKVALDEYLKGIQCSEYIEYVSQRVLEEINVFSENLDFILAELSFKYEPPTSTT